MARASASDSRDRFGGGREVELLRWFFEDELGGARSVRATGAPLRRTVSNLRERVGEASGEIELLGLLRSYAPDRSGRWIETGRAGSAPRWRLRARREFFRDPDGGGWVFLVPEVSTTSSTPIDELAIPLRRIDLRPAAVTVSFEPGGFERERGRFESGRGEAECYRLVIVPDASTISERLSRAAWSVRTEEVGELRRPFYYVSGHPVHRLHYVSGRPVHRPLPYQVDRLLVDHGLPASISRLAERF